jgi:hypothetical protein
MHYARRGIVTPEMEFVAIRENQRIESLRDAGLLAPTAGQSFGANIQRLITPSSCATRSRGQGDPAQQPQPPEASR